MRCTRSESERRAVSEPPWERTHRGYEGSNLPRVELKVRGQLHDKLPRAVQELQEDGTTLFLLARRHPPRHSVRMPKVERVPER